MGKTTPGDGPNSPRSSAAPHGPADPAAAVAWRDYTGGVLAFALVLALLYFGRSVLVPFAVALLLGLLIAPVVRLIKRVGLGHAVSVLVAVAASGMLLAAAAVVLGSQFIGIAAGLPRYEATIHEKLHKLDEYALGRLDTLTRETDRLLEPQQPTGPSAPERAGSTLAEPALPVGASTAPDVQRPRTGSVQLLIRLLASVWPPIEAAGIVCLVLVFVLLEHEALRDRFIRVVGTTNLRATTLALNDAGERLSRFFISQLAVNLGFGAVIAAGLAVLGLPHPVFWGALAMLLRFVPYVGIWLAALCAGTLALAVAPGWWLAGGTLAVFGLVELVAAQAVEPHLYGHRTGLSPLSVVAAAIFWSALWGPIGLILSTPLTLCVLVLGRHIPGLGFLELLLGNTQALTPPQRFYQRALAGDALEIIGVARRFLRRNSFARYCDVVLLPALHLGYADYAAGAIGPAQQERLRDVMVTVVSALATEKRSRRPGHGGSTLLEDLDPGRVLRRQRERLTGRWQGPLAVPPRSVSLCLGLGSPADTLAAELLVRALRVHKVDARHLSSEDLEGNPPSGADPGCVAVVYLVSAFPDGDGARLPSLAERIRDRLPSARLIGVLLPGVSALPNAAAQVQGLDHVAGSFVQALPFAIELQRGSGGSA